MNLAQRSLQSIAWKSVSNLVKLVVFFVRSVLLSRWLPKQVFGIYATANLVVGLTVYLPVFGMGGAFLHRTEETLDEAHAASVHFTLKLIFTVAWAATLVIGAILYTQDLTRLAIILVTLTTAGVELTQTGNMIHIRRVVHRRLALLQVVNVFATTAVALGFGWLSLQDPPYRVFMAGLESRNLALWALLGTDVVTMLLSIFFIYVWKPVWRPKIGWSSDTARYYLSFGRRNFVNQVLLKLLDNLDDLWTRLYLGTIPLADYSRAYTFATHPRRALAAPLNAVIGGTYAELKNNRLRLSRAFFRSNALILRGAFLIGGLLALIAPEFIRLLLTEKWLTMLTAFRLMLVFTLLDPIRQTVAHLFVAVGAPEKVGMARFTQLFVLVAGLFSLGPPLGIAGVALAVNLMLITGITFLLWHARQYVDFSLRRLFMAPTFALLPALLGGYGAGFLPGVVGSDWLTAGIKTVVFIIVFGTILLVLEFKDLLEISWPYLPEQLRIKLNNKYRLRGRP